MKLPLFILAALALLTSCTRPIPPQSSEHAPTAANIQPIAGGLLASFEKSEQAAVYFSGGASVLLGGRQTEIEGTFYADSEGWHCTNSENGDYLKLFRNGHAQGKAEGRFFTLLPVSAKAIQ